jgi:hypothetical protein
VKHDRSGIEARGAVPDETVVSFPFARTYAEKRDKRYRTTISPDIEAVNEVASLRELKEKLSDLPDVEKSALVHVQRVAPALVDDEHLLIFLRVDGFDVAVSCLFDAFALNCRICSSPFSIDTCLLRPLFS